MSNARSCDLRTINRGGGSNPHRRNSDSEVARACRALDFAAGPQTEPGALHPDTAPEAIAAAQCAAICELLDAGVADADLSGTVCLPPDVVRRRLAEIRLRRIA